MTKTITILKRPDGRVFGQRAAAPGAVRALSEGLVSPEPGWSARPGRLAEDRTPKTGAQRLQ